MKRLGVCSWSLQPNGLADLIERVHGCGMSRVQVALDPIASGSWGNDAVDRLRTESSVSFFSGMMATVGEDYSTLESIRRTGGIRPDEHWRANLDRSKRNAMIANQLGIELVTFHAGFIPNTKSLEYTTLIDRVHQIADAFGQHGIKLALETGQEQSEIMLDLLDIPALSKVGVNFDPANMILYGSGDPIGALEQLRDRVVQIHMKDAIASKSPNDWGTEVPAGQGEVDWDEFFTIVRSLPNEINIAIEREAGDQRISDIIMARDIAMMHGCEL
jgi:L-ribulose-5-phosphate 3-epimerase